LAPEEKSDGKDKNKKNAPKYKINPYLKEIARNYLIASGHPTDFADGNKVDLISVNFKEKAFYKKQWNAESIKARGLFLYKNGEVAMRSYNKFFNMYELPITSKPSLAKNLVFPVKAYKKENGFLGIMSVIKDEKGNYHLQLASKRTVAGEYKDYSCFMLINRVNGNRITIRVAIKPEHYSKIEVSDETLNEGLYLNFLGT